MLDVNKYINVEEKGIAGQDARTKEWYCKELPFKDEKDLELKIGKINRVFNKYNKQNGIRNKEGKSKPSSSPPKVKM